MNWDFVTEILSTLMLASVIGLNFGVWQGSVPAGMFCGLLCLNIFFFWERTIRALYHVKRPIFESEIRLRNFKP